MPRARVPGELVCYGRSVVHQEWPRMEEGGSGEPDQPLGSRPLQERAANGAQGRDGAVGLRQVARADLRSRSGPARPDPRRRRASSRPRSGSSCSSRRAWCSRTCCSSPTARSWPAPKRCSSDRQRRSSSRYCSPSRRSTTPTREGSGASGPLPWNARSACSTRRGRSWATPHASRVTRGEWPRDRSHGRRLDGPSAGALRDVAIWHCDFMPNRRCAIASAMRRSR